MTPQYTLLFHLLLISCLEMSARGRNVSLRPGELPIEIGSWAEFNCTLPCDHRNTHTLNWFIGNSRYRNVYLTFSGNLERHFTQVTGIEIDLQDMSNCDSSSGEGFSRQRLRVFASNLTAHLVNRTAIQCGAIRKEESATDLYSLFRVIEVIGDPTIPTSSCDSNGTTITTTPTPQPSPCPTATVTATSTETVTVTATETVTETIRVLYPTALPGEPAGSGQQQEFGSNGTSRTLSHLSMILLTLLLTAVSFRYMC